jgi:hypothetical protein
MARDLKWGPSPTSSDLNYVLTYAAKVWQVTSRASPNEDAPMLYSESIARISEYGWYFIRNAVRAHDSAISRHSRLSRIR